MSWLLGQFGVGAPAAPGNGATVPLFDSTVTFSKMGLAANQVTRIRFDFAGLNQPSAASGLAGFKSSDKGKTWFPCKFAYNGGTALLPATVSADTGSDSNSYDIFIGGAADVKFTFTASATGPTVWNPIITLQAGVPQSAL
jgi:hypothetical protein